MHAWVWCRSPTLRRVTVGMKARDSGANGGIIGNFGANTARCEEDTGAMEFPGMVTGMGPAAYAPSTKRKD